MTGATLSVYFEDPFWVALVERREESGISFCKVTFGAEPKSMEVYQYFSCAYYDLAFTPSLYCEQTEKKINPKRMKRQIARQVSRHPMSTKSQAALQLQKEMFKQEKRQKTKAEKEEEKQRQYQLRQAKKKEKHKGH